MRFARLSTRRLMVIVAGAAVLMAGPARLWQRSIRFERLALDHRTAIGKTQFSDLEIYLVCTSMQCEKGGTPAERELSVEAWERSDRMLRPWRLFFEYHSGQAAKYEAAAARPWSTVAPVPPPPSPPIAHLKAIRAWLNGDGHAPPLLP